jgi:hypothetical protein
VNRAIDAATSQQSLVRRVDDGVDVLLGDIANDDFEFHQLVKFLLSVRRLGWAEGSPHMLCPGTVNTWAVAPDVGQDDGDKLLPGEASSAHSGDVDDARRWLETYDELCRLKQTILTDLESQKVRVPPEGDAEVKDDEAMLSAEYERLLGRREFWQAEFEARRDR